MWKIALGAYLLFAVPAMSFECPVSEWPKPPKDEDCSAWISTADQIASDAKAYSAQCIANDRSDGDCLAAAKCIGQTANRVWQGGDCRRQVREMADDLLNNGIKELQASRDPDLKTLGERLEKGKSGYDQLQTLKQFSTDVQNFKSSSDAEKMDFIRGSAHKLLDRSPSFEANPLSQYLTKLSEDGVQSTALGAMDNLDKAFQQIEIDHAQYIGNVYLGNPDAGPSDVQTGGDHLVTTPGNDDELDAALARESDASDSAGSFDDRAKQLAEQFQASQNNVQADRDAATARKAADQAAAAAAARRASDQAAAAAARNAANQSPSYGDNPAPQQSGSWIDREYCPDGAADIRSGIINLQGCDYCDQEPDPRPGQTHENCSSEAALRRAVQYCGPLFDLASKRRGAGQCN